MSNPNILLANRRFINNPSTAVTESLFGLVCSNRNLAFLDYNKVIVRRDYLDVDTVKIVSGMGSGHEPAFAGFVGKGMLTAAIQGEIFTSPNCSEILSVLEKLTRKFDSGILVIIPNGTGYKLNFGLAVEKALNKGIKVKLMLVNDDIASVRYGIKTKQKRGLTGTIIVQKVAAAMAENNYSLNEIYSYCEQLQRDISSITISLISYSQTGSEQCRPCNITNMDASKVQFGAGLKGERGYFKTEVTAVEHMCKALFEHFTKESDGVKFEDDIPIILLINNMGTTSKMEECIFIKEVVKNLHNRNIVIKRLFCGQYMSTIDTTGFIVTVCKVHDPKLIQYIDAPCEAPFWHTTCNIDIEPTADYFLFTKALAKEPIELKGPQLNKKQSNMLFLVTQFACDAIISCARQINIMDCETGDGDTGSALQKGAEAINIHARTKLLNFTYPFVFFTMLSELTEKNVNGALGCVYSVMFEAAAGEFSDKMESHCVDVRIWLEALKKAVNALIVYTEAEEDDNTMFQPLKSCASGIETSLGNNNNSIDAFEKSVLAAEESVHKTKIPPRIYPDPGAHAISIILRAIFEGVKLRIK